MLVFWSYQVGDRAIMKSFVQENQTYGQKDMHMNPVQLEQ